MVALLVHAAGCTQSGGQRSRSAGWRGEASRDGAFTVDEAQSVVMSLSESVMFTVADACDVVMRRSERPEARVESASTRFGMGLASLAAATAPNVYVGFVDLITIVSLNRMSLEEPWATAMFDEQDRVLLHRTFYELEVELCDRACRVWTPAQLEELQQMIRSWREANPDRMELSSVRLLEFAASRQVGQASSISNAPISIFRVLMIDPAANLSPATRELAESRMFAERLAFFGKRFPIVLGWQMELLGARSVNSKAAQAVARDGEQVLDAVSGISASVASLAGSYDRTLNEFPKERAAAIEQINASLAERIDGMIEQVNKSLAERIDAMIAQTSAAFATERQAAVDQMRESLTQSLTASIDQLGAQFETQTQGTLDKAATLLAEERTQISDQLAARLAEADAKSRNLADRIATNLIYVIIIGALAVAVIAFIFRRIESRFSAK